MTSPWKITESTTTTADRALLLTPEGDGPYDALLVWFDQERVARVLARHKHGGKPVTTLGQMGQALTETVGRELRTLGWPRRQDFDQDILQSMSWHDDGLRVRVFWQETDNGPPRMFTEWKKWQPGKG